MNLELLKKNIKQNENVRLKVFKCPAKKNTIGWGRNLDNKGISIHEAEIMLNNDLLEIKLRLEDKLSYFSRLDDVRQNVLIEMAYNIGLSGFLKFKKTLDYVKRGLYEKASIEMLDSKWHEDFVKFDLLDGVRTGGLLRSEQLSKIMKEGKY